MIVQSAPDGTLPKLVRMWQHTALCEQFARAFGNAKFEAIKPLDAVAYVIGHHDAGWEEFDQDPAIDPRTRLPFNLVETPAEYILETSRRSPDFNEKHHPYSGLLSSMHSWGLYNGRYGLSDLVLLNSIAEGDRARADVMLDGELRRQAMLKAKLADDPSTAYLLDEQKIMQNYKQLQFNDTLALYFNRVHPSLRMAQTFRSVPLDVETDVSVTITPLRTGVYALSPFPFATSGSAFAFGGSRVQVPRDVGNSHRKAMQGLPVEWEVFELVDETAAH